MKFWFVPVVTSLCLSACGSEDYAISNISEFLVENEEKVLHWIEDEYKSGRFSQLIHIDFAPNDFGSMASEQKRTTFWKLENPRTSNPLSSVELPKNASALELKANYSIPEIWGGLRYRHNASDRAIEAFKHIFGCENGRATNPKFFKTFLLGSGGSHGGDALDEFSQKLKRVCGRGIDFAILGDAIALPGPFPKSSFDGLNKKGACIHFYQRQDLLAGMAIDGCVNVKIQSDSDHYSAAELGRRVSNLLLDRIQMDSGRWSLRPFLNSGQSYYFPQYMEVFYNRNPEIIFRDLASTDYTTSNRALRYATNLLVLSPSEFTSIMRGCPDSDFDLALKRLATVSDKAFNLKLSKMLRSSSVVRERASAVHFIDFENDSDATNLFRELLADPLIPIEAKRGAVEKIHFARRNWQPLLEVALEFPEMYASLARSFMLGFALRNAYANVRAEQADQIRPLIERLESDPSNELRLLARRMRWDLDAYERN